MHTIYNFNFLETISTQLKELLDCLTASPLNLETLSILRQFQNEHSSQQGVYLIYYDNSPVYLGKANNIAERLEQHQSKLSGRLNVVLASVGYKAILLDTSMSTATNEEILIAMFQRNTHGMWNKKGFGPKDPGKERDNTRPNWFDLKFPINSRFSILFENRNYLLNDFLVLIKQRLPYTFRYEIPADILSQSILLSTNELTAEQALQLVVNHLGVGWKGFILSFGMILYKTSNVYKYGREVIPQ